MSFVKASSLTERRPMKASIYGLQGSGKTLTALLFAEALAARRGGRIAFIDTEDGTKFYRIAIPDRKIHPAAFDFDILRTESLKEAIEALYGLDPKVHTCVVIDSLSDLSDAAVKAWESKNPGRDIELRDWGKVKRPLAELTKAWLRSTPCDVIEVGREKSVFDDEPQANGKTKLVKAGVAMRVLGEAQFEPDFNFRMELEGRRGEETVPSMFVEKDRTGILEGRWFTPPTVDTIRPIFPFIGDTVAVVTDPDEIAAADGELLDKDDSKAKVKEEKSSGILADMQAKIIGATSLADLGAAAGEIKKLARYLVEDHRNALRVLYEDRRSKLVAAAVPEGV